MKSRTETRRRRANEARTIRRRLPKPRRGATPRRERLTPGLQLYGARQRLGPCRKPLGAFTLAGPTLGAHTLRPRQCASGERQYFLGFDLTDAEEGVVARLVVDPAGAPLVRVFSTAAPFDKTVVFHRSECRLFHFSVDSTGWRINRIYQLNVSLEVDCELPSGDRIAGKAQDPGCL